MLFEPSRLTATFPEAPRFMPANQLGSRRALRAATFPRQPPAIHHPRNLSAIGSGAPTSACPKLFNKLRRKIMMRAAPPAAIAA